MNLYTIARTVGLTSIRVLFTQHPSIWGVIYPRFTRVSQTLIMFSFWFTIYTLYYQSRINSICEVPSSHLDTACIFSTTETEFRVSATTLFKYQIIVCTFQNLKICPSQHSNWASDDYRRYWEVVGDRHEHTREYWPFSAIPYASAASNKLVMQGACI